MTLAWPIGLVAILLVPAGLYAVRRIEARRRARLANLGGLGQVVGPAARAPRTLDRVASALTIAAFTLLAIGVARPEAVVSLPAVEGTLMLTFDVSASMLADDVEPSRIEAAKAVARSIVEKRPDGVVIGVAAFSDGGLSIQVPTADTSPVLAAIDRLVPSRGTSVGQGISVALTAIAQAESDTPSSYYSNRSLPPTPAPDPVAPGSHDAAAIVLISDGENNERPDPFEAAGEAADRGVRIVTVGVGTTAGTTVDLDGFLIQTALDEDSLRRIADRTAGSYAPAAELDPAVVYDGLSRHLVARESHVELTAILAAAGLVLLLTAAGLTIGRSGRLP